MKKILFISLLIGSIMAGSSQRAAAQYCTGSDPRIKVVNECGQNLVGFPVAIQIVPQPTDPYYVFWQRITATHADGIGCLSFPNLTGIPGAKVRFVPGSVPVAGVSSCSECGDLPAGKCAYYTPSNPVLYTSSSAMAGTIQTYTVTNPVNPNYTIAGNTASETNANWVYTPSAPVINTWSMDKCTTTIPITNNTNSYGTSVLYQVVTYNSNVNQTIGTTLSTSAWTSTLPTDLVPLLPAATAALKYYIFEVRVKTACSTSPTSYAATRVHLRYRIGPAGAAGMTVSGNQPKEGDFEVFRLCTSTEPVTAQNTSTSATCNPITQVRFRYRLLQTNYCSLTAPSFYISTTNWFPVASSYNLLTVTGNALSGNGYYMVEMQVQTQDGTISAWSVPSCIKVSAPPTTANGLVNFGFAGSPDADAQTTLSCTAAADGEQRSGVPTCTDADGWLSNGGTSANPTLVGIRLLNLADISFPNIFGGMQTHTITIQDVTSLPAILLGTFSGGSNYNATMNLNSLIPCAYPGGVPATYFFTNQMQTNINVFSGKIFSVTLTAIDVCAKSYSKTGYFKIIANTNWRTAQNATASSIVNDNALPPSLNLYPNPVNDLLTIAIETPFDGTAEMRILNIDGQTLKQQDIPVSQGPNHMNQSTSDLPTGVYMVHIQYEGTILTQKFVKM